MYLDWFACVLFFWAYINNNDKNEICKTISYIGYMIYCHPRRVDTSFIFLPILLKHSRICNYFTNYTPLKHNFCLFPLPYVCNNVIFFDCNDYDMWLFSRNLRSRKWGNRLSLKLMSNFKLANFLEYIPQKKQV